MILLEHRVVKMRQVLQNGMSFANERGTCGVFTRPLLFSMFTKVNVSILSVSLKIFLGDFFMSKIKKLLLSDIMEESSKTQRIAYVAVMTALLVVCNMFFEFKFADTQFSLTIFFSALTGIIIGPLYGFVACFLGDLVGFLYNSAGFMYMPWIGLAMGMVALISGLTMNLVNFRCKFSVYLKLFLVCISTFLICTVAINTTAFWIMYNTRKVPFFAYLVTRLFVQGQIWNSLFNYLLLFIAYPLIIKIKSMLKNRKA